MNQPPLLRFDDADLGYGRRAVLKGVSFELAAGSFLGILGYNGSGKTTLLRTLLGLLPCMRGGFFVRGASGEPMRFGYVPQKERLDPIFPLRVREVTSLGSCRRWDFLDRLRGRGKEALIERCLKECGVSDLAERRYSDLSGGQKQRVLIARALASEPDVLVLDEPLAGVDAATQQSLLELLRRLKQGRRFTILMVSHRIRSEKDIFTHIAWVDGGHVEFGPTAMMLAHEALARAFQAEL